MGGGAEFAFPTRKALVVDDDHLARRVVKQLLLCKGFVVWEARDGAEAIKIIEASAPECDFHLLITDVVMPGFRGDVVADRFLAACLEAGALLMSGYTDVQSINLEAPRHRWRFLAKPFTASALMDEVEALLAPASPWAGKTRKEIEAELHSSLKTSEEEYRRLKEEYATLAALAADIGPQTRDGQLAMQRVDEAGTAMEHAFSRYQRALKHFTRFVTEGQLPEWPHEAG